MHLGQHMTDEQRAVDSAVHMGNTNFLGHHHSAEARAKISAAMMGNTRKLGYHDSEETRAKLWKGGPQAYTRKSKAKRRLLGFTPLNAWFVGCEGHHVDNEQIIYMPYSLHHSVFHRQSDGRGMAQINAIAYTYLKQEIEAALAARETPYADGKELVTK